MRSVARIAVRPARRSSAVGSVAGLGDTAEGERRRQHGRVRHRDRPHHDGAGVDLETRGGVRGGIAEPRRDVGRLDISDGDVGDDPVRLYPQRVAESSDRRVDRGGRGATLPTATSASTASTTDSRERTCSSSPPLEMMAHPRSQLSGR